MKVDLELNWKKAGSNYWILVFLERIITVQSLLRNNLPTTEYEKDNNHNNNDNDNNNNWFAASI